MKTEDIKKIAAAYQEIVAEAKKKLDAVGKADADIDNDGDVDSSDDYLHNRRKAVSKAIGKGKAKVEEEVEELEEAPRRKGAPKMTGDSFAAQRAKDAAHNAAMGRTKTGRKKPVRTMTSTQRSLASLRNEEVELDEISSDLKSRYAKKATTSLKRATRNKAKAHDDMDRADANIGRGYSGDRSVDIDKQHNRMDRAADRAYKHGKTIAKRTTGLKRANEEAENQWPVYKRILEMRRDDHTKGATEPEAMDSKASGKEKEFVNMHGGLDGNSTNIDGAKAAADTAKAATANIKAGAGMNRPGDQKTGDKNIIKSTFAK